MTHPAGDDPDSSAASGVRPFLSLPAAPPVPIAQPLPGQSTTSLRPFVITAGRTAAADADIGLETQVTVRPGIWPARLSPEMRAIAGICAEPLSVAEISARLRMHLGVTRILVGDLRAAGVLDVQVLTDEFPDPDTIRRVIRGLRAIS